MEIRCAIDLVGSSEAQLNDDGVLRTADFYACSILIVDDDQMICELINAHLGAAGFQNTDIAHDGLEGLNRITDTKPDVVILDIEMPKLTGIQVLEKIRSDPRYDDMPIIVETAKDKPDVRNEVLRAGATNIISKPIDFDVLIQRVRDHLSHRLLVKNLKAYQQRVRQELEAARGMQLQLLPRTRDIQKLEQKYGVKLDWHYNPSSELGGDWWGAHLINDQKFGIFAVDFTGHGVGAAINTFRLHTIMEDIQPETNSPARYLEALNELLVDLIPRGQFATMHYAIIDIVENTLTYASAGHTPPLIGNPDAKTLSVGDPSGLPMGIQKSIEYTDHEFDLRPGDFLLLYSDALTETPGSDLLPLGDDGFADLVRETLSLPGDEVALQWLLDNFYTRSKEPPPDDVTAIWIQRQR